MATRILLDPRQDLADATLGPAPVLVEATPTGIREDGSIVILPTTVSFVVNTAADVVELLTPDVSWAWTIEVRRIVGQVRVIGQGVQGGSVLARRTVTWTDAAEVAWADLTDLDPATLEPTADTVASWAATQALAQQVKASLDALVAGAPSALDTFLEVATQLASDESGAATLAALIGTKAPLVSPALTGTPTAPTAATSDSSTQLATTALVAAKVAALGTSVAATYQPLALLPLQTSLPTATVAVTANANVDNLWPGWFNAGQSTYTDISAMTDPAVFGPYFYGGQPYRDTWWSGGAAIYNQLNSGTNSTWALAVRISGSTRLLVGMNGAVGSLTASQFVIEIDGQKLSRRYIDTGIVYDGHQTGLLLTFPDTRGHDIRIWSKAGFKLVAVDFGGTVTPTPAPFGGRKRGLFSGDSWVEGTSQAAGAVSLAAALQLAADWDVAYLGNGGTGYIATGPSYASAFGSSQRLAAMTSFAPDLWVFLGSINDPEDTAAVQAAATAAFSSLASSLPSAKGIVIGPQLSGHPLAGAGVQAAATAASNVLAYIDPVAAGWVAPAGVTGPTDGSHPSVIGTEHLAAHIIAAVRAVTVAHSDTSW